MTRAALRPFIALGAAALIVLSAIACGGNDDGDGADTYTGEASLSDDAIPFSTGPFSGRIEPDWYAVYLDIRDVSTGQSSLSRGQFVKDVIANFFRQPSVTHALYVFLEDKPDFSSSMNILRCEPTATVSIIGNPENMLKFYKENNIDAQVVGTATYANSNYDIVKVDLNDEYDTHIVVLKTDNCYTPATLVSKKGDREKVEDFRAVLSELSIDTTKLPR